MRYTLKYSDNYYHSNIVPPFPGSREAEHFSSQRILNDKLGQLEDIEEELGIDLITLFKALTNGIYVNDGESIIFYPARELRLGYDTHYGKGNELCIQKDGGYAGNNKLVSLRNYGKSWALSEKELQDVSHN